MNNRISLIRNTRPIKYFRCLSTKAGQTPAEFCLDLIRRNDRESYLCTLFLPQSIRSAAIAIRALNVEIALVEDQTSDNAISRMRYQFWVDTLDKIYNGEPPRSPVALELHRILKKHKLSKRYFKRLLNARLEKLGTSGFCNLESLEKYSESSTSSIYYLLLEANKITSVDADHAASHLGKAHGITTAIRSVPYHARRRNCVLPQDVLMRHNVSMEAIFRGEKSKALGDTVFEVSSRAKLHLDKALSLKHVWKNEGASIFLPATLVDAYLEKLRRVDFDVFDPKLYEKNNLLPLQLCWKNFIGKF